MGHYAFCLTINNPRFIPDLKSIEVLEKNLLSHSICYMIVGKEGYNMIDIKYKKRTPHLQMVVVYGVQTSFTIVKNMFPRAHIEPLKGTLKAAVEYCKKEGAYREYGKLPYAEYLVGRQLRPQEVVELYDRLCLSKVLNSPTVRTSSYPTTKTGHLYCSTTDLDWLTYDGEGGEDIREGVSITPLRKGEAQPSPSHLPENLVRYRVPGTIIIDGDEYIPDPMLSIDEWELNRLNNDSYPRLWD